MKGIPTGAQFYVGSSGSSTSAIRPGQTQQGGGIALGNSGTINSAPTGGAGTTLFGDSLSRKPPVQAQNKPLVMDGMQASPRQRLPDQPATNGMSFAPKPPTSAPSAPQQPHISGLTSTGGTSIQHVVNRIISASSSRDRSANTGQGASAAVVPVPKGTNTFGLDLASLLANRDGNHHGEGGGFQSTGGVSHRLGSAATASRSKPPTIPTASGLYNTATTASQQQPTNHQLAANGTTIGTSSGSGSVPYLVQMGGGSRVQSAGRFKPQPPPQASQIAMGQVVPSSQVATAMNTNTQRTIEPNVPTTHTMSAYTSQQQARAQPPMPMPAKQQQEETTDGDDVSEQEPENKFQAPTAVAMQPPPTSNAPTYASATPRYSGTEPSEAQPRSARANVPADGTNGKMSAPQAAELYDNCLTRYERREMMDYDEVYFVGANAAKIDAPLPDAPNFGYDDDRGDYNVVKGDHIAFRYEVQSELGKGSFGQVLKCQDHKKHSACAVKIIRNKKRFHQQATVEIRILDHLRSRDPEDRSCTIRMLNYFKFRSHTIITFEIHSMNLYELAKLNKYQPFAPALIKRFTAQILVAMSFLWKEQIVHCDLKPENILLKYENKTSIKLIDFGSSCFETERVYTYIQSRFYRAPEIILGLSYGRPIDLWSLGCIVCEMQMGYPIFPGESEKEQLLCIMEVLGVPPSRIVDRSPRKKEFFDANGNPKLFANSRNKMRKPGTKDIMKTLHTEDASFVDFILCFLQWDPAERITPNEAMRHPWIAECFQQDTVERSQQPPQQQPTAPSSRPRLGSARPQQVPTTAPKSNLPSIDATPVVANSYPGVSNTTRGTSGLPANQTWRLANRKVGSAHFTRQQVVPSSGGGAGGAEA